MNKIKLVFAALFACAALPLQAQPDITGTWAGGLPVGPDTELEIHFVLTRDADGYSTVLTSPDQGGIQDMAATSTSFDGEQLVIAVDDLAGRYEGNFTDGVFQGNWHQQGEALPLSLVPWVQRDLSEADKDMLRGSWVGALSVQGTALTIVYRFENDASGEFVGYLDSPDQGATGVPVAGIELADGKLSFDIPQISASYESTLGPDAMEGTFRQAGIIAEPLNMTRGDYIARGLELEPDVAARIEGSWVGSIDSPAGVSMTLVMRFEPAEGGGMSAYLDSPDQGARDIPISEVSLVGDKLDLVIPAVQGSLSATLSDDAITGTWAQGNNAMPVTLNRGEYVPQVVSLELSDEAYDRVAGEWTGVLNGLDIFIRIETIDSGLRVATFEVPAQGSGRLPIPTITVEGDQVSIAMPAIGAGFAGTLAGDSIEGTWTQAGTPFELNLSR